MAKASKPKQSKPPKAKTEKTPKPKNKGSRPDRFGGGIDDW